MAQPLILRNREYKQFKGKALWVLLLSYASFLIWLYWWDDAKGLYRFVVPIVSFVWLIFHYFIIKIQKIEISNSGIKHISGYSFFLRNYSSDWEVSWAEVRRAFLNRSQNDLNSPQTPLLILLKNKRMVKLIPSQWIDSLGAQPKMNPRNLFSLMFRRERLYSSVVNNNPLVKAFAERELLTEELCENPEFTDITADSLVATLIFTFLLLISYYFYEVTSGLSEVYTGTLPYFWVLVAGIITTLWCYRFIKKTKLNHGEKIIVAMLLGLGVGLAAYPFLMRVNQWTDTAGIQTYKYKLAEKGVWIPQDQSLQLPDISFGYKAEIYWNQFKINSVKDFELRKGGLGLYQLNMDPIRKDWKGFYEGDQGYYDRKLNE